jgi:hypothetical protein
MDEIIETIRAAVAGGASDEARAAGAQACRAVLAALDATPGAPLATVSAAEAPPLALGGDIASALSALRGLPPEQLLDLAIGRLRAALPADVAPPSIAPLKFHLLPVPRLT